MPSSNPLSFLRPLYDIAVWQFLLMLGCKQEPNEDGEYPSNTHVRFTWRMHVVVANFMCKLLQLHAFEHLQGQLLDEGAKKATGNWEVGQRASGKLVEWCQDQWRRKEPVLPKSSAAFTENEPATVAWTENIPLCYRCGVPCPSCRNELTSELPEEMSTARAILCYDAIHACGNQSTSPDENDDAVDENGDASKQELAPRPQFRMELRSTRKRKNTDAAN